MVGVVSWKMSWSNDLCTHARVAGSLLRPGQLVGRDGKLGRGGRSEREQPVAGALPSWVMKCLAKPMGFISEILRVSKRPRRSPRETRCISARLLIPLWLMLFTKANTPWTTYKVSRDRNHFGNIGRASLNENTCSG